MQIPHGRQRSLETSNVSGHVEEGGVGVDLLHAFAVRQQHAGSVRELQCHSAVLVERAGNSLGGAMRDEHASQGTLLLKLPRHCQHRDSEPYAQQRGVLPAVVRGIEEDIGAAVCASEVGVALKSMRLYSVAQLGST